jgi:hypothetical protein
MKKYFNRWSILAVIIILVSIPFWLPLLLRIFGYYVNTPGWRVAEIAVEQNNIDLCSKIIITPSVERISLSKAEQKDLCIFKYAEITKNPFICEALLPSDYAMTCLNFAENYPHGECGLSRNDKLVCEIPGSAVVLSEYEIKQIDNCEAYRNLNNRQVIAWCYAERAHRFGEIDKCLSYAISDEEKDYCYYERATMLGSLDKNYCNFIIDKPMQLGCQMRIKTWMKYPELKPTEDIEIPSAS